MLLGTCQPDTAASLHSLELKEQGLCYRYRYERNQIMSCCLMLRTTLSSQFSHPPIRYFSQKAERTSLCPLPRPKLPISRDPQGGQQHLLMRMRVRHSDFQQCMKAKVEALLPFPCLRATGVDSSLVSSPHAAFGTASLTLQLQLDLTLEVGGGGGGGGGDLEKGEWGAGL